MYQKSRVQSVNSSAGEKTPFFVFDKPFIEYGDSSQNDPDCNAGEVEPAQRPSKLIRNCNEFCMVKFGPSFYPHRDKARLIPTCCRYCLPKNKLMIKISEVNKERGIKNCLALNGKAEPKNSWHTKLIPHVIKYFWDKSKILKKCHAVTYKDIEDDPELLTTINEEINEQTESNIKSKIISFAKNICLTPWNRLRFMVSFWASRILLKCIFRAIFIHTGQIEQLRNTQKIGLPIVFIPLHRSVLDSVILTWVLTHYKIRPPVFFGNHVISSDYFLKALINLTGVASTVHYTVKQDLGKDVVQAGVSSYLRILLKNGNNCELLLESRRSRSGFPSTYLYGRELLEVMINMLESKQLEDAHIVPVCISYEILPEENEMMESLDITTRNVKRPSFLNSFWKRLWRPLGTVRVDFGQSFSLREFERELNSSMKWATEFSEGDGCSITMPSYELRWKNSCSISSLPAFYGDLNNAFETNRTFVDLLANHAIYDAGHCGAIMATHVIAFFLVKMYPNGILFDKTLKEFKKFQLLLMRKNRDLGFTGDVNDVIRRAIHVLGPNLVSETVTKGTTFIKAVDSSKAKLQLCYYANHVTSMFIHEAVFATVVFSLIEKSITISTLVDEIISVVPIRDVAHAFKQVYKLIKSEFYTHPSCLCIDDAIMMYLNEFQDRGIIRIVEKRKHRKQDHQSDDDWESDTGLRDRFQYSDDDIHISINHETIQKLTFWKNLIVGYFEVYRTSCMQLFSLLPTSETQVVEIEDEVLLNKMIESGLKYSRQNLCGEVLSRNTIKNFLNRLLDLEILGQRDTDNKRYFYLTDEFASSKAIDKLYATLDRHVFC